MSVCASVLRGTPFGCGDIIQNYWQGTWSAIGPGHQSFFAGSSIDSFVRRLLSLYLEGVLSYFLPFSAFATGGTCSCYLQSLLPCEDVKRDEAENNRRRIFTLSNWFASSSSSSSKPTFLRRSKVSSQTLPPSANHISTYATSSWSMQ